MCFNLKVDKVKSCAWKLNPWKLSHSKNCLMMMMMIIVEMYSLFPLSFFSVSLLFGEGTQLMARVWRQWNKYGVFSYLNNPWEIRQFVTLFPTTKMGITISPVAKSILWVALSTPSPQQSDMHEIHLLAYLQNPEYFWMFMTPLPIPSELCPILTKRSECHMGHSH